MVVNGVQMSAGVSHLKYDFYTFQKVFIKGYCVYIARIYNGYAGYFSE